MLDCPSAWLYMIRHCDESGCPLQALAISPSDSASHLYFAYYNGIVGNTGDVNGALILHMMT